MSGEPGGRGPAPPAATARHPETDLIEQWNHLDLIVERMVTSLVGPEGGAAEESGDAAAEELPVAALEELEGLRRRVSLLEHENNELLDVVVAQAREIEQLRQAKDRLDNGHSHLLRVLRDAHGEVEQLRRRLRERGGPGDGANG